jgi:hypothetical protein
LSVSEPRAEQFDGWKLCPTLIATRQALTSSLLIPQLAAKLQIAVRAARVKIHYVLGFVFQVMPM